MSSPLASPRSSTSSNDRNASEIPLTPMSELGLEKGTESLFLNESDAEDIRVATDSTPMKVVQAYRTRKDTRSEAQDQFAGFSFGRPPSLEAPISTKSATVGPRIIPRATPPSPPHSPSHPSPSASFSFGSCPSIPLISTPTAELGAFEYPDLDHISPALESAPLRASGSSSSSSSLSSGHSSASSSFSRASTSNHMRGPLPLGLALGESHRRNSIISRPSLSTSSVSSSSHSTATITGYPSAPQNRRSSTTSTIATIPAAGRRPSIIHSATTEATLPLPSISSILPSTNDSESSYVPSPLYNGSVRRASILFPPKHLHQPVPPSLLARRGSMPISSLDGSSPFSPGRGSGTRSSISIPMGGYGRPGDITSHRLYNRRDSIMSVGSSQGSGSTLRGSTGTMRGEDESGELSRRQSLKESRRRSGVGESRELAAGRLRGDDETCAAQGSAGVTRRSSMPIHHALSATTRRQEDDRLQSTDTNTPRSRSPSSPGSRASSRLPPASQYHASPRRARHSLSHSTTPQMDSDDNIPESGLVPDTDMHMGWTKRPSMSGRTLSTSEESDESGEGVESAAGSRISGLGNGVLFSDPWATSSGSSDSGSSAAGEGERIGERSKGSTLVEMGRPALETVQSDRTETGDM